MSEPNDERAALDLDALRGYLADQGIPILGPLTATVITGGRSNLTFKVHDDMHAWVVRRPPTAGLTPSAHDVGREFRIVEALQRTAVPVAPAIANCADASVMGFPFSVVGYVPGRVLRTQVDLTGLSKGEISRCHREMIRVLVELHAVSYRDVGLEEFGRPEGFVERQVRRWRQQWTRVATRELVEVDRLYRSLCGRLPPPMEASLVHGDYRIDNTLLDPRNVGRVLALVDWEMATLGDPLTDVATMCAYRHPEFDHVVGEPAASTSDRWPTVDKIVEDYGAESGRDLCNFDFYMGLAYFKLAVIAEGIGSRYLAGAGDGPGYSTAAKSVPGLLAAGLSALSGKG